MYLSKSINSKSVIDNFSHYNVILVVQKKNYEIIFLIILYSNIYNYFNELIHYSIYQLYIFYL